MKDHCSLCDCSVANNFIPTYGKGNKNATIVWISPFAPTKFENKHGVFTTNVYLPLLQALGDNDFGNYNSYFTHIIKCKMNKFPIELEINNCVDNLIEELSQLKQLKIIVLIGATTFKLFTNLSFNKYNNKPIFTKYVLIGIPNPGFITRTETKYDLSVIKYLHNLTL